MILQTLAYAVLIFGVPWVFVCLVERWILSCPNGDDVDGGASC